MRGALTGLSGPCTANVSIGEVANRSSTHVAPEYPPSPTLYPESPTMKS